MIAGLTAWFMTTGEAGFRTQARGLATRVAGEARELIIAPRAPWRYLPAAITPFALAGLDPRKDRPAPPWPDLLVTCGRKTTAASMAVRRLSGGRTLTVHVQNPLTRLDGFDLVAAMDHDGISGPNVINVPTALHDVTPERLAAAGLEWRARLTTPGRALIGVVLGGTTRKQVFSAETARPLIEGLSRLKHATGARLAITPSRRTPPDVLALLNAVFGADPDVFVWDLKGDNPYLGILALSDRLVATSDSVSMISEALATPHPVEVFGPDGGRRHALFLNGLIERGLVRRFTGDPTPPAAGGPIDATGVVAAAVEALLYKRMGVSG